jgi:NitT/TauT family transport system permease protein
MLESAKITTTNTSPSPVDRILGLLQTNSLTLASVVGAIVFWDLLAWYVDNSLFLTSLGSILIRGAELTRSGELQTHIWISFLEFAGGFGLAAVAGILSGVGLAASRTARGLFDPWISMLYATPILALGPLFVLWLGIGLASKIAIIFLTAVFPITINTLVGLTTTDRLHVEVARSLGASAGQIYTKVRIPSATPFIIAGLRLSVARALVGVVVAELFGSRAGLGFMIMTASQSFDTAALFVGVGILAVAGVGSVYALKSLEKALAPWRFKDEEP